MRKKSKIQKKERMYVTYWISVEAKTAMNLAVAEHKQNYSKIKGIITDLGVKIVTGLLEKHGPAWLIEHKEQLVDEIVSNL
jgi:hypothetical protein